MEVQPTAGRVLIRRQETKDVSKGGIILPDKSKEKSQHGTVVAVGPGKGAGNEYASPALYIGDKVLFNSYSGTEIDVGGGDMIIIEWSEVIAVIKE